MSISHVPFVHVTHKLYIYFLFFRKAFVNPLDITTPEEQKIIDEGEESRVLRERERNESLLKHPPSEEERLLIHQMFLDTLDPA